MGLEDHLDKLKTFKVIAETNKLGEAAKRVGLTQPSLSRLINTLEEALNTKLFYRSRSGTFLTPSGEELLVYTNQILAPLKDLEAKMKSGDNNNSGYLKVGSYETLSEYLWPNFLSALKKKNKKLTVSIRTSDSKAHIKALEVGEIDLLVDAEPRVVGDFDSYSLYTDSFSFYVSHKSSDKNILKRPVLYVPNVCDENDKSLESYITDVGLQNNDRMELDSFTAVRAFCEKDLGIAVLPTRLAQSAMKKKIIKQPSLKKLQRRFGKHTIFATISSSRLQDERIKYLVRELKKWLKNS